MGRIMNHIWRFNRWYDDLDQTNPGARAAGFLGTVFMVLLVPVVIRIATGSQSLWLDVGPAFLMGIAGMLRWYWLVSACHTYKKESNE
jgi:hypothetical protein